MKLNYFSSVTALFIGLFFVGNLTSSQGQFLSDGSPRAKKSKSPYVSTPTPTPTDTPSVTDSPKTNNPNWTPTSHENRLTIVTFEKHEAGTDTHPLKVTLGANLYRLDLPQDKLRVIYNPANERYLGLEISDGTYWNFTWPKVQAAVKASTRYTTRLQSLTSDGLDNYTNIATPTPTPAPTAPPAPASPGPSLPNTASTSASPPILSATQMADDMNATNPLADVPTYIWRPSESKKKVSGVRCTLWIGTNSSGDSIQAWCTEDVVPDADRAFKELREVNEPMALVPIRELVPPIVFMVYDQLHKSHITPLFIHWGGAKQGNTFSCTKVEYESYSPNLFHIPGSFRKTTLATMDGIMNTD
jgi:hypothetical protein